MLRRLFDFFVFTSLFIACCAVLMVYQTALLFEEQFPFALYAFVFSGSVCSYNFHWYLTPPTIPGTTRKLRWNLSNRQLHFGLFVAGALGAMVTSILLIDHWLWLGFTAFLTFLYSAPMINHPLTAWLRKIAVGKTIFLSAAWVHVTALLPLLIVGDVGPGQAYFILNRFFFIYAICIVFDRRDVESDRKAGIKSLITYLSLKGVDLLFWFSTMMTFFTSILLKEWLASTELVILCIPALIMGLLYEHSKKNVSDYLYYFLLDGLMALSSLILILIKFVR